MRYGLWGLLLLALSANAGELRPFGADSRAALERAHAGQPWVLAFWSLDCVYCPDEIRHLGALVRTHPQLKLVLVSVDGREMQAEAAAKLQQWLPAGQGERWIFADDADRLYYAVDRKWHGELPRTYFHDGAGGTLARSGRVEEAWLADWARGLRR